MRAAVLIVLLLIGASACAADSGTLQALFKDKVIVVIDGKRQMLTRDEPTPDGVKLISTDTATEEAEIEIGGKRQTLKLGMVMGGFKAGSVAATLLFAEPSGHF